MKKNDKLIIVEQTFNSPINMVWNSITELNQMRQWFFENIPAFKAEVGFETKFNVKSGDRDFMHLWKISEVVPNKKITYNWKYEVYPGEGLVTFELYKEDNLTHLKLTNTVIESFPDDIPEFTRESCIGGWTFFIKQNLKEYLEKI